MVEDRFDPIVYRGITAEAALGMGADTC